LARFLGLPDNIWQHAFVREVAKNATTLTYTSKDSITPIRDEQ